ncbi:uncharacterized protein PRCAT00003743001 [Priceomyces carsonii]|uniref:uncharacterized protein n=1 Tax=Priceomyces carsonii TaxID=28549 RepID=UPI002ED9B980|nr:unnamed protein product [Priceomyces carsonii]
MATIGTFITFLLFGSMILGQSTKDLVGTWSSKSNTVFTGPGFYDPVDELLIEPDLPGISYSFTEDGHYEEALYRITSDAKNHSCAVATLSFQHGTYELKSNGSIILTPIAVDGRQLLSEPCGDYETSSQYSRYEQATWFKSFLVYVNSYHGRYTLQLFQFDGSKMQPLYLAYRPPLMLPTSALNPTDKESETKSTLSEKVKRSLENQYRTTARKDFSNENYDFYWWIGVSMLAVGSGAIFLR